MGCGMGEGTVIEEILEIIMQCGPRIKSYQKRLESGCVVDQKVFDGAE